MSFNEKKNVFSSLDVEGWHHRLNRKTSSKKGFYEIVIKVLYKEVRGMDNRLKMVSEKKLRRNQRKAATNISGKIFEMWRLYNSNSLTVNSLLRKVTEVYTAP